MRPENKIQDDLVLALENQCNMRIRTIVSSLFKVPVKYLYGDHTGVCNCNLCNNGSVAPTQQKAPPKPKRKQ